MRREIQYSIAFDTLIVLMKVAVKPRQGNEVERVNTETDADGNADVGEILLSYWKHEIIEKYFRGLKTSKSISNWEKSKYLHMKTDKWAKGVLRLKLADT